MYSSHCHDNIPYMYVYIVTWQNDVYVCNRADKVGFDDNLRDDFPYFYSKPMLLVPTRINVKQYLYFWRIVIFFSLLLNLHLIIFFCIWLITMFGIAVVFRYTSDNACLYLFTLLNFC